MLITGGEKLLSQFNGMSKGKKNRNKECILGSITKLNNSLLRQLSRKFCLLKYCIIMKHRNCKSSKILNACFETLNYLGFMFKTFLIISFFKISSLSLDNIHSAVYSKQLVCTVPWLSEKVEARLQRKAQQN